MRQDSDGGQKGEAVGTTVSEEVSSQYQEVAKELETAAQHCRFAATHFDEGNMALGSAHAYAASGHLISVKAILDELAAIHASKTQLELDPRDYG